MVSSIPKNLDVPRAEPTATVQRGQTAKTGFARTKKIIRKINK